VVDRLRVAGLARVGGQPLHSRYTDVTQPLCEEGAAQAVACSGGTVRYARAEQEILTPEPHSEQGGLMNEGVAVAPAVRDDAVAESGVREPELAEGAFRDEQEEEEEEEGEEEEEEEEYDAEAVATLLWPDDAAPIHWIDGPIEQELPHEPAVDSSSTRSRRSSGSIVDALVNASIADEAQTVECDAMRSQAEQEEQRRQLDALELQLAKLEAEKRVLCSELGPSRSKSKDVQLLPAYRLRASAANITRDDGEPGARDGPANHHSPVSSVPNKQANEPSREVDPRRVLHNCPTAFICPITQEIFRYPVIASDGHSYERGAIETWLSTNLPLSTNAAPTSPVTNLPLPTTALFPNHGLRSQVLEWREKEGLPSDDNATRAPSEADGAQSEKGYAGLMETRTGRASLPDSDSGTEDTDDDDDPFDLALAEALRRSVLDQQLPGQVRDSPMWHSPWNTGGETSHVAELIRARRARGLRPAFGPDTTGSPTVHRDRSARSGSTEHRSSACTVM
jgi:hypothetical protein